jgi:Flp pilus assembly protein, pilin Flp
MKNLFARFVQEESGQDMIEYVLLLAFVCVAAAATVTTVGTDVQSIWTATQTKTGAAATAAS